MAKLLDQRTAIALLQDHGWRVTKGGKHVVKVVKRGERPITLPRHGGESYGKRLTNAIIKQAGLEAKERQWSSRSSYAKKARGSGPRSPSSLDASRQLER